MSSLADHWTLEPGLDFLNHGSFGACPQVVLQAQQELRAELERQPVAFFVRKYNERLDAARERLAAFLGADPDGLVPVQNATSGVNAVLRSMDLRPEDELVVTDHEYNACRNALDFVAQRSGARVVVVEIPFPCAGPESVTEGVLEAATDRTRLVLIDHITSQTAMILPLKQIVDRLAERNIDVLVDGAHAPGMLPLELSALGAAYYTGNCHKWLCAPKGAAFLYVREDRRDGVRPLTISHGANMPRAGRTRLHDEFDWMGTDDPTPFLCVPRALEFLGSLLPGGWPEIRARNHELALQARTLLCDTLGIESPCPDSMIGSLASVPLPDGSAEPPRSPLYLDALQDVLLLEHRIEVPVIPWPAPPRRLLRVSCQLYNELPQYERLAAALEARLS